MSINISDEIKSVIEEFVNKPDLTYNDILDFLSNYSLDQDEQIEMFISLCDASSNKDQMTEFFIDFIKNSFKNVNTDQIKIEIGLLLADIINMGHFNNNEILNLIQKTGAASGPIIRLCNENVQNLLIDNNMILINSSVIKYVKNQNRRKQLIYGNTDKFSKDEIMNIIRFTECSVNEKFELFYDLARAGIFKPSEFEIDMHTIINSFGDDKLKQEAVDRFINIKNKRIKPVVKTQPGLLSDSFINMFCIDTNNLVLNNRGQYSVELDPTYDQVMKYEVHDGMCVIVDRDLKQYIIPTNDRDSFKAIQSYLEELKFTQIKEMGIPWLSTNLYAWGEIVGNDTKKNKWNQLSEMETELTRSGMTYGNLLYTLGTHEPLPKEITDNAVVASGLSIQTGMMKKNLPVNYIYEDMKYKTNSVGTFNIIDDIIVFINRDGVPYLMNVTEQTLQNLSQLGFTYNPDLNLPISKDTQIINDPETSKKFETISSASVELSPEILEQYLQVETITL